ncbi:hypothetical protein D030_5236A, partial [Vibrio parahaemolyticus AQ3810]
MRFIVRV